MSLIVNMDNPSKCWDCEFFDEMFINDIGGRRPQRTEIGWCRLCRKEVEGIDYREYKPAWCTLVQIPGVLEDTIKLMLGII